MTKCKDKKDIDKQLENKHMKSIKEKANEYANEQDLRMAYNGSCDNCQQGFVVGANYVLDAITECMPKTHSFNPNEAIDIIANRIKQLKKK